jgi:hypothetical protein
MGMICVTIVDILEIICKFEVLQTFGHFM